MKKIVSVLLIMLLLTGTLAACLEAPESEETEVQATSVETPEPEDTSDMLIFNTYESEVSVDEYELCYCGEHYAHEELREPTPPLNIHQFWRPSPADDGNQAVDTEADAAFLAVFENVHTFSYSQLETPWYNTLVFWPDEPLREISFLSLANEFHDVGDGYFSLNTREVLFTVDALLPTEAIVFNVAFSHYLMPHGGVVFTDASGVQHRMLLVESMRGGCFPHFLLNPYVESDFLVWR